MNVKLLTPAELAEILQVSENVLGQWRIADRGPRWVKSGRFIRYDVADVDAWIEESKVARKLSA